MAMRVPLEIMVSGYNNEPFACTGFGHIRASAAIINEQGQALVKLDSDDTYSVWCGGETAILKNENTGSNYYLAARKHPKPGKLYFVTDYEEGTSAFERTLRCIENYVIFTDKDTYVFWKPMGFPTEKTVFEIQHMRMWQFNSWKHFYEVKRQKQKK